MAEGRAWDCYDAYLFDIDGTLLHCTDAVHYFAFCDALTRTAGRPMNLDGVIAHGNVDTGILRDALRLSGLPEHLWRPQLDAACAILREQVDLNKADLRVTPTPDAFALLKHLQARQAKLGVATGNLESIGRLKLQHCGLLQYFHFGGWSDTFETRADVFAHALSLAKEAAGSSATVCVVGDTPADVQAAKLNCLDVIAVATGNFTDAELEQHLPTRCVGSFSELLQRLTTN